MLTSVAPPTAWDRVALVHSVLASFVAYAFQDLEPAAPSPFDRVVPLVIDAQDVLLAGHGRAERVVYTTEFSGTLHIWTQGMGELDLCLRIETPGGELVREDDNSGGEKTPYAKLTVERGRELVAIVAVADGDSLGAFELCVIAAPESEPTLAASEAATLAIVEVQRLRDIGDLDGARELAVQSLETLNALPESAASELIDARNAEFGRLAHGLAILRPASVAFGRVHRHRARTRPDDHPDLQWIRTNLGATLSQLGDFRSARVLLTRALETAARKFPPDHPEVQVVRMNLAGTMFLLGELHDARQLQAQDLEIQLRTLPADHPDIQRTRMNLAATIAGLGDHEGARKLLEQALDVCTRTSPADDLDLQRVRQNLAAVLSELGDIHGARALEEQVLEVRARTLPADHPELQAIRLNLANRMLAAGDLTGARALAEHVLEVQSRALPEDHLHLQVTRARLATTLYELGDLQGARALQAQVLEVRSRSLPADHLLVQNARQSLAGTLKALGDLQSARELCELSLEVYLRTLPDDHGDVQMARVNLAGTMAALGDLAGARDLFEKVLEVFSSTLPDDDRNVQRARHSLSATLHRLGRYEDALSLGEKVLDVFERTLPSDHHELQMTRQTLAVMLLDASRGEAGAGAAQQRARATELLRVRSQAQSRLAREVRLQAPAREAEERCASLASELGFLFSVVVGYEGLAPLAELTPHAFEYSEATRNAAVSSSALARRSSGSIEYAASRERLRTASAELAMLVQRGTSGEEFQRALAERESAESALLRLARELSRGNAASVELDAANLSIALGGDSVAVAFRRYPRRGVDSLCAFVVRSRDPSSGADRPAALALLDLGPIAPVHVAVQSWHEALGVDGGRGLGATPSDPGRNAHAIAVEIRRLVFDPLRGALGDAQRVVLVLDDVLHLVPFDALPAETGGEELLGDRLHMETRATLAELLDAPLSLPGSNELVVLGGVDYDGDASGAGVMLALGTASILRGGAFEGGFAALPATQRELEGVQQVFARTMGGEPGLSVLAGKRATKDALLEAVPRARWLHIATHGWFASESIRSWDDPRPLDAFAGVGERMSGIETVLGMSPMLLCGLALVGANKPENAVGRAPGLMTADELSTLDLSNCELAVLSACDTARGESRRAGQGVASLQKALQMAGARSVITSLWKVPDEATKDLMLDFYRRLWVEKKPKWQALWEAKTRMRNAKDERGAPKYTTRDWAAWVLTGDPD